MNSEKKKLSGAAFKKIRLAKDAEVSKITQNINQFFVKGMNDCFTVIFLNDFEWNFHLSA